MKDKTIIWAIILLLTVPSLSACLISPSSYEKRASNAENRLIAKVQQLPVPRGTTLIKQVIVPGGGQMPQCDGREAQALFGTDELSYGEVMDFYTSAMQDAGWHPHLEAMTNRGRSFDLGDEFSLAVSDLYNVSSIGKDVVLEAKGKFQTVYLLELSTPIELPVPPQCRGG